MGRLFFTETQAERYLELETRQLPFPDGTLRPHTDFKITWLAFDFIVEAGNFTKGYLVSVANQNLEALGYSFKDSLRCLLSDIQPALIKKLKVVPKHPRYARIF